MTHFYSPQDTQPHRLEKVNFSADSSFPNELSFPKETLNKVAHIKTSIILDSIKIVDVTF
jgi:hypothetical protein